MKMYLIKIILTGSLFLLLTNCGNDISDSSTSLELDQKEKKIIAFMDFDIQDNTINEGILRNYLAPIVSTHCEKAKAPLGLEVYLLYRNTANMELIGQLSLPKGKEAGDLFCSKKSDDFFNEARRNLYMLFKTQSNQSPIFKIIESIKVLRHKLASINFENTDVEIIYISNMMECHSPTDETKCQFNFLQEGKNEINAYSLNAATQQIEDEVSCIGKEIKKYKSSFSETGLPKVKLNVIWLKDITFGAGEYSNVDIVDFWTAFFAKIGMRANFLEKEIFLEKL